MKEMLAGAIAAFLSLFGAHQAPPDQVLVASAAAASVIEQPISTPTLVTVATTSVTSEIVPAPPDLSSYVTKTELNAAFDERLAPLSALVPALHRFIAGFPTTQTTTSPVFVPSYSGVSAPLTVGGWAASQKIDNLSGATLSNVTVNGISGLTTSDIPDLSGAYLAIASTTMARSTLGISYATSNDIANAGAIATWGDSITLGWNGATPFQFSLANLTGYNVYRYGVGGDTSSQIAARMLVATEKYTWPTVIWAGRNDYSNPTTVKANIAAMVAALESAGNTNYIILGILNGSYGGTEYVGQSGYNTIVQLNADLATLYGSHFIDIRSYLVSNYNPSIAQDVIDYGRDVPPSSLRSDAIHPNSAGNALVAHKIYEHKALLGIPDTENASQPLATVSGARGVLSSPGFQLLQQSSIGNESAPIDATELTDSSGWTSVDWTGDYDSGFTHTPGNTSTLRRAVSIAVSTRYQVRFTISSRTAGYVNVAIGGSDTTTNNFSANGLQTAGLVTLASSGNITFIPSSDFDGKISGISVKKITALYNPTYAIFDSISAATFEIRSSLASLFNTFVGVEAGSFNTTGSRNTAQGVHALRFNTTGSYNTAQGVVALPWNTTGSYNTAQGYGALQSNTTGSYNSAQGVTALQSNTTGIYNSALGYNAGRYIANGSSANSTATSSVFIGDNTKALANGQANQIVIGSGATGVGSNSVVLGNDSILKTILKGKVGVGTSTPWRTLSVTGTVGFDGLTGSTGAGSLCLTANREVVYNSGSDNCLSSLRSTKHDINPLVVDALEQVLALQPVSFIYNNDASSTVRYGFIADDAVTVDKHFGTYDAEGNLSGVDDRSIISVVVKALQGVIGKVAEFAESFATKELTFTRAVGQEIEVQTAKAQTLCLGSTCITESQLQELLVGQPAVAVSAGAGSGEEEDADGTPSTPPTIEIHGNNPATVNVGASYNDLGASITGPTDADKNLGIALFLDGVSAPNGIQLDTSVPGQHVIEYVATNAAGAATSTRTVIVQAPEPETIVQPEAATTTMQ